jgi:hypothetical protein
VGTLDVDLTWGPNFKDGPRRFKQKRDNTKLSDKDPVQSYEESLG